VDTQVGDLLERAILGEAAQEADARDDRDIRRVAAGDARLQRRRVRLAVSLVLDAPAGLRREVGQDLLEGLFLAATPQRQDVDLAGRAARDRPAARATAGARTGLGRRRSSATASTTAAAARSRD